MYNMNLKPLYNHEDVNDYADQCKTTPDKSNTEKENIISCGSAKYGQDSYCEEKKPTRSQKSINMSVAFDVVNRIQEKIQQSIDKGKLKNSTHISFNITQQNERFPDNTRVIGTYYYADKKQIHMCMLDSMKIINEYDDSQTQLNNITYSKDDLEYLYSFIFEVSKKRY